MKKTWFRRLVLWSLTMAIFFLGGAQWFVVVKGPQWVSKVLGGALHRQVSVRRVYWVPPFSLVFEDGVIQGLGGWRSLSVEGTPWIQRDGCLEIRRVVLRGPEGVVTFPRKAFFKGGKAPLAGVAERGTTPSKEASGRLKIRCVRVREVLIQEGRLVGTQGKRAVVFEHIHGEVREGVFSLDGGKARLTLMAGGPRIKGWSARWIRWDGWFDLGQRAVWGRLEAGGWQEDPLMSADIDMRDGWVKVDGRMAVFASGEAKAEAAETGFLTGVLRRLRGPKGQEVSFRFQTRMEEFSLDGLSFSGEISL